MIPPVASPKRGEPLRADWAASVAGAINTLASDFETRGKPLANQRNRRGGSPAGKSVLPFEPEFETDEDGNTYLKSVADGYIPFGRNFFRASGLSVPASASSGLLLLKITHPTTSSTVPTAVLELDSNNVYIRQDGSVTLYSFRNTDAATTLLPLYAFKDGAILCDLRCYLALAIRE